MAHVAYIIRRFAGAGRAFFAAVPLLALGCGSAQPQPSAAAPARGEATRPDPAPEPPSPTPVAADPAPETPVFSGCVLHAGDAEKHTTRVKHADGTLEAPVVSGKCWYGAECVQDHARQLPGDGDVGLHCDGKACVCEYRPITPRGPVVRTQFELAEDCTSESQAKRLLRERCMAQMTVKD